MDTTKLVTMANQIADFFAAQRGDAATDTADHIVKNWDPRMRTALADHLAAGGEGLTSVARRAAEIVASESA